MATLSTIAAIQKLYVAYFNRPADVAGLAFWASVVDRAGGDTNAVSQAFSQSAEYTALYAGKVPGAIIDTIYLNLFGRHAEADGLQFWSNAYQTGVTGLADIVTVVAGGARDTDLVALNSKVSVAGEFTAALEAGGFAAAYSGPAALAAAKAFLAAVINSASSHSAQAGLADAVAALAAITDGSAAHSVDQQGAPSVPAGELPQEALGSVPSPDIAPELVGASKYMALLQCSVSWYGKFIQQAPLGTPLTLTYSFMSAVPAYDNDWLYKLQPNVERVTGFQPLPEAGRAATRQILDAISKVTGLSFLEVQDSLGGEIRLGMSKLSGNMAGMAYEPGVDDGISNDNPKSLANLDQQGLYGDIFLNAAMLANDSMTPGSEGYYVLMHEIGHALGLKHAVVSSAGLTAAEDQQAYTVMTGSYTPGSLASHYGAYDLAALQYLYGTAANAASHSAGVRQVFDGSGMTMTVNEAVNRVVNEVVNETGGAAGGVLLGTDLTDRMLGAAGADLLWGRGGNDRLEGGAGNDQLDGGIGDDVLMGGAGNDQLQGSWGADRLDGGAGVDTLNGGDGSDVLVASGDGDTLLGGNWAPAGAPDVVDYSLAMAGVRVLLSTALENNSTEYHFDGTKGYAHVIGTGQVSGMATQDTLINVNGVIGTSFDDYLSDSDRFYFDEVLNGGAGNDTLVSHGGGNYAYSTHDTLIGGTGDDRYILSIFQPTDAAITITEAPGQGLDVIEITGGTAVLTLPDNVEDVAGGVWARLAITGNALDNSMVAGNDQDALRGEGGNDSLDGGLGNDTLNGGAGADILIGGGGSDQLAGGSGADVFVYRFYATTEAQHDVITDFNAADGDRIRLEGGLTYTVAASSSGNALLALADGETIELLGIAAGQVALDWFTTA